MEHPKVTVVTVTFGNRLKFLSQVVTAVMKDSYVTNFIIVDNGSNNKLEIEAEVKPYGERITVLRQEHNLGSAGGFALALVEAKKIECDHVFMLDDDCVPAEGFVQDFLNTLDLFPSKKVVLTGSRIDLPGNKDFFYQPLLSNTSAQNTFFEIFSLRKLYLFLRKLSGKTKSIDYTRPFVPIMPNRAFVYGGAFLPISAVKEAPLPDASLVLYGDDVEYSWGIKRLGYDSYVCARPIIRDLEVSFGGDHILGLFDPEAQLFKVYYRLRNMVRISRRNTTQNPIVLFLNIIVWTLGLFTLGLFKYGFSVAYFKRVRLVGIAIIAGYHDDYPTPQEAKLPNSR